MTLLQKWLTTFGRYVMLMNRTFSVPERMRMFWKQYVKEMAQLGVAHLVLHRRRYLHPDEGEH